MDKNYLAVPPLTPEQNFVANLDHAIMFWQASPRNAEVNDAVRIALIEIRNAYAKTHGMSVAWVDAT